MRFGLVTTVFVALLLGALHLLEMPRARAAGELGYPTDATALHSSSGNVANAAATATLTATVGHKVYLCGFLFTSTGSTAAAIVSPTVTGLAGGTLTQTYLTVAGATTANAPLQVTFSPCIPASAAGTNIVVTLPALGAGNTNATASAWGFIQ